MRDKDPQKEVIMTTKIIIKSVYPNTGLPQPAKVKYLEATQRGVAKKNATLKTISINKDFIKDGSAFRIVLAKSEVTGKAIDVSITTSVNKGFTNT